MTGLLVSTPYVRDALDRGVLRRLPVFDRITEDGVAWDATERSQAAFVRADVILWATGFRPATTHLAPLHLRSVHGGIQLDQTTAVADRRVQLVGYGPSASTIGANRAGRVAARGVAAWLDAQDLPVGRAG
ncbi:MAG: hypothetical protein ACXVWZ_14575 [Nocardioides sp.]